MGHRGQEFTDPSGITIISERTRIPGEIPEDFSPAIRMARRLSQENSSDLSFYWTDLLERQVVLPWTTTKGRSLVEDSVLTFSRIEGQSVSSGITIRGYKVEHSLLHLKNVMDEAVEVKGWVTVRMAVPDPENNRIILFIEEYSANLLQHLALSYGTSVVAVSILKDMPPVYLQ